MIKADFSLLAIGYSVLAAAVIAATHLAGSDYRERPLSRTMGLVLLLCLVSIQLYHYAWLRYGNAGVDGPIYTALLFLVAPAFHLYSRPILEPAFRLRPIDSAHALPLLAACVLPVPLAQPLAFAIGAGYLGWLAHALLRLRGQRAGFRREIALLGLALVIAVAVTVLMLLAPAGLGAPFIAVYAIAIAGALLLVQVALAQTPHLTEAVDQAARSAYAQSTLVSVDVKSTLAALEALMQDGHVYEDPSLNLPGLAARLGLSPHQLSELINRHLGKGFSRHLRDHRLAAARARLIDRPSTPILEIALAVGFSSQSSFYAAFREAEGMSPGQFRKVHRRRS